MALSPDALERASRRMTEQADLIRQQVRAIKLMAEEHTPIEREVEILRGMHQLFENLREDLEALLHS